MISAVLLAGVMVEFMMIFGGGAPPRIIDRRINA